MENNDTSPNTTYGDVTSDQVYYWPSFAPPGQMNLTMNEFELREQSKSPTESVCSFELMSAIGENGEQQNDNNGDGEEDANGVEEEESGEMEVTEHQRIEKKCFAVLKIRPIGINSTAHWPNLKFEFVLEDSRGAVPGSSFSGSSDGPLVAPTIGQMSVGILSRHFGLTMEQLLAKFALKLQIRVRIDDSEAVFVDIEEAEWGTKLVEHRGIYKAMLYPKFEEGKNGHDDGKGGAAKVTKLTADQREQEEVPNQQQNASSNSDNGQQRNQQNKDAVSTRGGQILFRMTNFKAFAKGCGPKLVYSKPTVDINGMPWAIRVKHCDDCVRLDLFCAANPNDMVWSCRAAFIVGAVSVSNSGQFLKKKGNLDEFRPFDAIGPCWGVEFAKIEKMMDPANGFYDEKEDTVTFKAEVVAETPKGMPCVQNVDTLLVNGKAIYVNKHILAANSIFFRKLFFGKAAEKTPKIHLGGNPSAVADFERMIATMDPMNLELDDNCVENVLLLAHRFQLDSVLNRCADFLLKKSKKSAICKFRLAHQCQIIAMKKKVLKDMTRDDFAVAGEKFLGNLLDNKQLDAEAVNELMERHSEIFGTK